MIRRVVIIGAGMGGLTAALRLAQQGLSVQIIEARPEAGGLASSFENDGFLFDAGPYILLDRPGLEWAFRSLGLELSDHLTLRRIDHVYEVRSTQNATVHFYADRQRTAAGIAMRSGREAANVTNVSSRKCRTHIRDSVRFYTFHDPGPRGFFATGPLHKFLFYLDR